MSSGELIRGNCPGCKIPDGNFPGGNFMGAIVRRVVVQGGNVRIPFHSYYVTT